MGIAPAARPYGSSSCCIGGPLRERRPRIQMLQENQHGSAEVGSTDRRQRMQGTPLPPRGANAIESSVAIQRPIVEVFGFYRDFRNLPRFLGDVIAIEPIDRATSRWTIQGPLGVRVNWTIRVTEERPNELISYETITAPGLRTYWTIHFAPGPEANKTEVREVMQVPLGRFGRAALALIGKFPAEEVASNLRRLKELMETGSVSDTSYAVAGKFAQHQNQHERRK
jgi:uncharacterized membrane protein